MNPHEITIALGFSAYVQVMLWAWLGMATAATGMICIKALRRNRKG